MWGDAGREQARLGIAVSGGPDSLALLLLAQAALPGRVEAATVDHGLRAASAREADFVAGLCRERSIPHAILSCEIAPGNVQDRARAGRYAALEIWAKRHGIAAIATAHHADDQAETLMMRLNRGSGLAGLAGIRGCTNLPDGETALVRPLLGWRRHDLAHLVEAAGIDAVCDPSNTDRRFERTRMRAALQDAAWIDPVSLARSAAHLAEAEAALDTVAEREWIECVVPDGSALRYRPIGPDLVRKLVVKRIIAQLGGGAELSQITDLVARLARGESGNLGGVMARSRSDVWLFEPEPPRMR